MRTALGFRHHSGWAIAVVVGAADPPELLHRERVELCPAGLPRQVYHDVGERSLSHAAAAKRIAQVETAVAGAALEVVQRLADAYGARRAALVAEPRELPALPAILASHPLWHAAEGELYRDALAEAAISARLRVVHVPPKQVGATAAGALSQTDAELHALLAGLGKLAGPPWRRDHKDATLAALVALVALT